MPMRPAAAHDLFEQECSFPADRATVVEAVGETAIAAPGGERTQIATVLEWADETRYASVDDLYCTLMANLPDEHIGRKHYDDRSSTHPRDTTHAF